MFLIAKIVRGRRLLHQLEQEMEKEKATKALEQREKLTKYGLIPHQHNQSTENQKGGMMDQQHIELKGGMTNAGPKGVLVNMELDGGTTEWEIQQKEMLDQQQQQAAERIKQRRKRAVRQRTDSSLPSGEEVDQTLAAGREQAMRRTSSMPSIVESAEQHLHHLHLPHHQLSVFPRKALLRPIRHYNYEDKLSKLQKRALRFTWQRLLTRNGGKRIEIVFEEVFDRMMRSLSIMREMFNTRTFISAMSRCEIATPRDHARLIVKMFEAAIKNLEVEQCKRTDTAGDFDPKLLGQAHSALRPYGFTSALWEAFGEAVIDIVLNQEAVRDLPGASQAWVVLTACLVDQLRAGFESVRECPFKRNQHKENQQMNGKEGTSADEGEEGMPNQVQQLGDELAIYQQNSPSTGRRRTITLMEEEIEGIGTLGGGVNNHQNLHNFARERRSCFSTIMSTGMEGGNRGGKDGESAAATHSSRVQLKFLQDMASTEL